MTLPDNKPVNQSASKVTVIYFQVEQDQTARLTFFVSTPTLIIFPQFLFSLLSSQTQASRHISLTFFLLHCSPPCIQINFPEGSVKSSMPCASETNTAFHLTHDTSTFCSLCVVHVCTQAWYSYVSGCPCYMEKLCSLCQLRPRCTEIRFTLTSYTICHLFSSSSLGVSYIAFFLQSHADF